MKTAQGGWDGDLTLHLRGRSRKKTMKPNRTFVLIIICTLLAGIPRSAYSQSANEYDALDRYIANAQQAWEVPGMAVAIVQGDSTVFAKGYGLRTFGTRDSVDTHTVFAIASLSKAFTAASLGMLVEQGKISWDDRVTDYLPYFQMYDPYVTREITIRDLFSHHSGLHTFGGDLIWYGTTYDRKEVIRRIRYLKPRLGFRSAYGYQNIMLLAAGEIIPVVTGQTWDDFVRDSLFLPLGMTGTTTSVRTLEGRPNVATPHIHHNGKIITVPYRNVDNVGSAAAINSSVHDLSLWIRMWLRSDSSSGAGRLSDRMKHQLWTPQTLIPISLSGLQSIPTRHFLTAALGWFAIDYHGRKVLSHSGGMDGMISCIALVPEEDFGFVILTNSINSLPTALMYRILDMRLGAPARDWSAEGLSRVRDREKKETERREKAESERAKNSRPSLPLKMYAGTYRSTIYGDVQVAVEHGALVIHFLPTPSFVGDLTHWQYDTFQIELRDPVLPTGLVTFVLNEDGVAEEMRINIPNPDFDFTELELHRVE